MRCWLSIAILTAFVVGCGGPKTAPVSGLITLDGRPLSDVSVSFMPETSGLEAPASNGRTDESGRYKLTVTMTGKDGALVGKHAVRVAFIGKPNTGPNADIRDPTQVDPIPPHELSFEVKPGNNEANFDLKTR